MYAARKSNGSPSYGPLHPRTVHEYPPRSGNIVDFTCTRTNLPRYSTTKSYGITSPQGLFKCSASSSARIMNFNSTHSPRTFGCLIRIPRFFIPVSLSYPSPRSTARRPSPPHPNRCLFPIWTTGDFSVKVGCHTNQVYFRGCPVENHLTHLTCRDHP